MIYRWVFSLCVILVSSNGITQIQDFNVVNIKKDTTRLIEDPEKSYIIIFSNNNSCRSCFRPFNSPEDHLNRLLINKSHFIRFVCRISSDAGSRRNHIITLMGEMPNIANQNNIFFDIYHADYVYNKQAIDGVFGEYQINQTPAIVLYRPGLPIEVFRYTIIIEYFKQNSIFSLTKMIEFKDSIDKVRR